MKYQLLQQRLDLFWQQELELELLSSHEPYPLKENHASCFAVELETPVKIWATKCHVIFSRFQKIFLKFFFATYFTGVT